MTHRDNLVLVVYQQHGLRHVIEKKKIVRLEKTPRREYESRTLGVF